MASAADKRQLEAIKGLVRRWCSDPVQLRFVIVIALFGVGLFGIVRPLSARLDTARAANKDAKTEARLAEELRHFYEQSREYGPRLSMSADLVDWQNYVLSTLRCTSATLISLEPKAPLQKQPFTVLDMELVARGTSFTEFADFASRLEHGERCVRIEKVKIERQQSSMYVTMVIRGLVRATPDEKPAKDADNVAKGKDAKGKDGKTALAKEKTAKGAAPTPKAGAPSPTTPERTTEASDGAADTPSGAGERAPEGGGDV
jgi:hypothetical protein